MDKLFTLQRMATNTGFKVRFQCTGCGQCCSGDPSQHYVEVSREEQRRIYQLLELDGRRFRREYIETAEDGSEGIRLLDSGRCPFLEHDHRCGIYSVRPNQCLTYPFWPELLGSRLGWEREKARCEGIGKGPEIAEQEISAKLALQRRKY